MWVIQIHVLFYLYFVTEGPMFMYLMVIVALQDREIDGLNEQLEEDSRCLEHLQIQLVEEKSKRSRVERENEMLQEQVNMLMNMIQEEETDQIPDEEDQDQP